MGYYPPGDFVCSRHGLAHFEIKDDGRVVCWNAIESKHLLDLTRENFEKVFDQMKSIASILGIDY
jgi:hypothetical protein